MNRSPGRKKLRKSGKSKERHQSPTSTSTPVTTPRSSRTGTNGSSGGSSPPMGMESDDLMAYSQAMVDPVTGVYWNYEASPSVRAELWRLLHADSDDEELPPPKPVTPVIRVRMRTKPVESPPKFDQEAIDILESMKEICAKIQATRKASEAPEPLVASPAKKHDVFFDDSADDSFLVRCTQAAEQEALQSDPGEGTSSEDKKIETSTKAKTTNASAFDDDDGFDLLLSQIEIPTELSEQPQKKNVPKAAPNALQKAMSSTLPKGAPQAGPSSTAWRRVYSTPEATTTSGALLPQNSNIKQRHVSGVKCSKEEIEKKRMEAIKRRQNSIQQSQKFKFKRTS